MKKLIKLFINWIRGLFNVETYAPITKPFPPESTTVKRKYNPAWWKRLYNLKKRNLLVSTNLQPLKTFGNFSPVKKIKGLKYE